MNKTTLILIVVVTAFSLPALAQDSSEPWTQDQLISPEKLSTVITDSFSTKPLIIDVGPAGLIKGAVEIGPTSTKENLQKLEQLLASQKKDREIVLYCGCCPYKKCPNIRPAFQLASTMNFKNLKLLFLPENLKVNWINHGYPMEH